MHQYVCWLSNVALHKARQVLQLVVGWGVAFEKNVFFLFITPIYCKTMFVHSAFIQFTVSICKIEILSTIWNLTLVKTGFRENINNNESCSLFVMAHSRLKHDLNWTACVLYLWNIEDTWDWNHDHCKSLSKFRCSTMHQLIWEQSALSYKFDLDEDP